MASTGILAEFSKKPPAVKVAIFVVIALLLGALYWQLVYAGLRKDIQAAEDTAQALLSDKRKVEEDERRFAELTEKQATLERLIRENENALPTRAQLPAFFDMLNRKVGEASVEVRRWDYLAEVPVDETTMKVPVEIELQGTFYEIKKFFHLLFKMNQSERDEPAEGEPAEASDAVEERDRIITIEELRLRDPVVRNNELLLTATFRASTFRKELPEPELPVEDPKKKKKAATKPAPKGQAGLPQEAKDRTEDAMKKSEDRAEKAGAERVKGGL